ncbi:NAD(P)/FAD-dependent oxidoreductase [Tsukamurella sp. 1534]|uniref:flavin-containing monooxygenase n=1 Tax=Tsukamurella sp. 1534 TaxID=1151061 RepID=UPI0002F357D4|nr:NAD(P)/FAD-dependent oxidoreductase [Tsukamurella sp. 1534]
MANPEAIYQDVLIVGAGLAGIDTAYRVSNEVPHLSYTILEQRAEMGGTWDLFKYPGIRSDSDIFSLSYPFLPWKGTNRLANGSEIKAYIEEAAAKFGIDQRIRFNTKVGTVDFDSAADLWTITADHQGEQVVYQARFLVACTGYYDYEAGYEPPFPGVEDFRGQVVHPQHWPEDLDYQDKKVVVIGSGATAITLIPAMADDVDHITMLQRSPTYVLPVPNADPLTMFGAKVLPAPVAHNITRNVNAVINVGQYVLARTFPKASRKFLRNINKSMLPEGYDVDVHFKPKYEPWDQRLCVVPNGDLFTTIKQGKAEVVTDTIDRFTENGILLNSGRELEADIIITATGLQLLAFGGVDVNVDGAPVKPNDRFAYNGYMLEGVPNFSFIIGYTNNSWTLRADISARAIARLLNHMVTRKYTHVVPDLGGKVLTEHPALDLSSGYVQRSPDAMPKAATEQPWMIRHNFVLDSLDYRRSRVDAPELKFGTVDAPSTAGV